jgi:hypothetical protein
MKLTDEALRDMELAAAVRAAAHILSEAIEVAVKSGLIVAVEVSDEAPPRVEVVVDKG